MTIIHKTIQDNLEKKKGGTQRIKRKKVLNLEMEQTKSNKSGM